jgi:hypothetical protein
MAALARTDWLENWKSLKKKNSSSSGPLDKRSKCVNGRQTPRLGSDGKSLLELK